MASETKLPTDEFDLPSPTLESETSIKASENAGLATEQETVSVMALEQGIAPPSSAAAPPSGSISLPSFDPVSSPPAAVPSTASGTPQFADDGDLIEKEWVEKAKEIVEKTKNDPFIQSREVNIIRADYLKKRYNKDIEVSH